MLHKYNVCTAEGYVTRINGEYIFSFNFIYTFQWTFTVDPLTYSFRPISD